MATNVNLILYHMIQTELAERGLQPAHPTQPDLCHDICVVYAQGSQEKKQDIPALVTGTLYTEKLALLGIIMLQNMKQFFSV
jgi:hypothetical protein